MEFSFLKLSDSRFSKLSDISSDIGQIFFASVFIGPLFADKFNWTVVISGLILSFVFWAICLILTKS